MQLAARRGDTVREWRFRLLRGQILLNSRRAEEVLTDMSKSVPPGPGFANLAARKRMLEGQAESILGRAATADQYLEEAHRAAQTSSDKELVMEVEIRQGSILMQRDRPDDAIRILESALSHARALHSSYAEGSVLTNLGFIELRRHRYGEAATYSAQAARVAGTGLSILYAAAQNNLAVSLLNLGDPDRAVAIGLDSVARSERSGAKFYLQTALGIVGEAYLAKNDLRTAVPHLQRALTVATELNHISDAALWCTNLAAINIVLRDWSGAQAFNDEAIRLKQSIEDHTLQYNLLNAARIAQGRGDLDAAAEHYEHALAESTSDPVASWEAHGGKAVLATLRKHTPLAIREFETAIEIVEKTRSDMPSPDLRLPFLTPRIQLYQAYVEVSLSQGNIEQALAVADSSRAQVLAERSNSAPVRRLLPGAFLDLARTTRATLLSYWLTPERSHAWVVTPREIHHVELPGAVQIEPAATQYREAVERHLADPLRTPLPAGEKLYNMLLAPVRQYLPSGSRVVVVPDGVLHGLNLESLPVPGPSPHYLIADISLEIAPSLASVAALHTNQPRASRLLLLGDPISNDPGFPTLAAASQEISAVRANFSSSDQVVVTRESATPQAFLAAAGGPYAAIHFTAHGVANRENPLESAVLLSGGKLYARDVMDLPLQADLVTVSACRGAGQRTYSGEGLVGFAWAFLHAGARNVIAGLWDVNDQSTAGLMDVLYRELKAGKRPAEALRAAKLTMIESKGNLRKPYYWAPFQLYTVSP